MQLVYCKMRTKRVPNSLSSKPLGLLKHSPCTRPFVLSLSMAVSSSPAVKAQHKNVSLFFSLSICLSLYFPPSRCKHHQNRSSSLGRSLSGPRGCKQNLRRSWCKQPPLPSVSAGVVPARYRRHSVTKGGSDRKTTPKQAATIVSDLAFHLQHGVVCGSHTMSTFLLLHPRIV